MSSTRDESGNDRRPAGRLRLAGCLLATLAFGVVTRRVHLDAPLWDKSAGDVAYAVTVYFALAFVLPRTRPLWLALLALSFCFGIELFQLTGVPVNISRRWHWAHWVLGSTFAWHDIACYALGIAIAFTTNAARARWSIHRQCRKPESFLDSPP
jgi:hypothetical protein